MRDRLSGEDYVRPPLVATEAANPAVAVWRFRAVMLLLLAVATYVLVKLFLHFSGVNDEDPGVDALRYVSGMLSRT